MGKIKQLNEKLDKQLCKILDAVIKWLDSREKYQIATLFIAILLYQYITFFFIFSLWYWSTGLMLIFYYWLVSRKKELMRNDKKD